MMDVTLNTVVFDNHTDVLGLCLSRLRQHTPDCLPLRIWVNGFSSAVRDYCREFAAARSATSVHFSKNIRHGPALDRLMEMCDTRYFMCFDMDSFPIASGWLEDLQRRLDAGASCAGVIERAVGKRNKWGEYVHPSCLMIAKAEFESLGLRLEGFPGWRADTAETVTIRINQAGRWYDGWRYTHSHFRECWGFRYYGGYWCHIWLSSRLAEMVAKNKGSRITKLHGVSPQRYRELFTQFAEDIAEGHFSEELADSGRPPLRPPSAARRRRKLRPKMTRAQRRERRRSRRGASG